MIPHHRFLFCFIGFAKRMDFLPQPPLDDGGSSFFRVLFAVYTLIRHHITHSSIIYANKTYPHLLTTHTHTRHVTFALHIVMSHFICLV